MLVVKSQENHCFIDLNVGKLLCLLPFVDGLIYFTEINNFGMRMDRYSLP